MCRASGVVLDAHDVVNPILEAVEVDDTDTLLVTTTDSLVNHPSGLGRTATLTPAREGELANRLALVQVRVEGEDEMAQTLGLAYPQECARECEEIRDR